MAGKGMQYAVRQNTATHWLEGLLGDAKSRAAVDAYIKEATKDGGTFDPLQFVEDQGASGRDDIRYSFNKLFGDEASGAYWNDIERSHRAEVLRLTLESVIALGNPVKIYWLTMAKIKDEHIQGFRCQIDEEVIPGINQKITVVHLITPPMASKEVDTPGAVLNTKPRSWLIGTTDALQDQADHMNDVHVQLFGDENYSTRVDAQDFSAENADLQFKPTELVDKVSLLQLRYYDPDNAKDAMDADDYKNDPVE